MPLELGYPNNNIDTVGPRPSNFSGQRALLFVIQNQGALFCHALAPKCPVLHADRTDTRHGSSSDTLRDKFCCLDAQA